MQSLNKRVRALEEETEQTEQRLQGALDKLNEATKTADESERSRKVLESRSVGDEERIQLLQQQVNEAKYIAEDADRKYDEVCVLNFRSLSFVL